MRIVLASKSGVRKDILKKEDEFIQFLDRYKPIANKEKIGKAYNNIERFREIISDPLNLLIKMSI